MAAETYRESTEALRAEVERLTREVERLTAKRPTRWAVDPDPRGASYGWSEWACAWAVLLTLAVVGVGAVWVAVGNDPRVIRAAWVATACAVAWACAFVRRVTTEAPR